MNGAIYNEIDAYAAEWTRNLIAAGHVAPGVVDERSIVDLGPDDVAGPGQRHFFSGIAGWSYALRLAGVPDDVDVWTGSAPCQGLSDAGRKLGFADPRHLWPVWFRLIDAVRPRVVLGEQVASRLGLEWLDLVCADLEGAGYAVRAADTCAASVGAPHIRQRLYFVAYADGLERRLFVQSRGSRRENAQVGRCGEAGRLADASGERRIEGIDEREGQVDWSRPADGGRTDGAMAHPEVERRGARRIDSSHRRSTIEPRRYGDAGRMGNPDGEPARRDGGATPRAETSSEREGGIDGRVGDESGAPSRARNVWSDADWLPCSDGKSRAVEPGTFPLAHGLPAEMGRTRARRLKGYGNAIVAQQAAAFIRAALMEAA